MKLSYRAKEKIRQAIRSGQIKGNSTRALQSTLNKKKIVRRAADELVVAKHTSTHLKLACALLYWGEGSKTDGRVAFTNSDPMMIRVFMQLLRRCFDLDETKWRAVIHLHSYHDEVKQKRFWQSITVISANNVTIYKKPNSGQNTRANYPGCITVRYYDKNLFYQLEALYKQFAIQYGGLV